MAAELSVAPGGRRGGHHFTPVSLSQSLLGVFRVSDIGKICHFLSSSTLTEGLQVTENVKKERTRKNALYATAGSPSPANVGQIQKKEQWNPLKTASKVMASLGCMRRTFPLRASAWENQISVRTEILQHAPKAFTVFSLHG